MVTRLVNIVVDALDVEGLARFWAAALGWELVEDYLQDGEGVVRSPDDTLLELITVPTRAPKAGKNRVHLDLAAASPTSRDAMIEDLLGAGARRIDIGQGDVPWDVFADPEGNEFCVAGPEVTSSDRLHAVCLDASDVERQAAFWAAATGWVLEASGDGWAALRDPRGKGPALTMGPPVAPKPAKLRVHLDVAPRAGDDQREEVQRLIDLGGTGRDIGQSDVPWVVLVDPEDNEFCVLTPR